MKRYRRSQQASVASQHCQHANHTKALVSPLIAKIYFYSWTTCNYLTVTVTRLGYHTKDISTNNPDS